MIPDFAPWQWVLGALSALAIGLAMTGMPGLGSFIAPLMVLAVGDARYAAAWTLPILSTADVFAVLVWRKHADARKLFCDEHVFAQPQAAKEQFVATGAWFFLVINLAKVPIYSWHHLFSSRSLMFDLLMVPAVVCGAFGGLWLVHRVPQRAFDTLIVLLTGISAVVLFR